MCTILTTGIEAALTAATIFKGIQNANTQKAYGRYQTEVLSAKAQEMKLKAKQEYQKGIEEARKQKLDSILKVNSVKAKTAASNIALSSETAQYIVEDEKQQGELNALETFKSFKQNSDSYMKSAQDYYDKAVLNSYNTQKTYKKQIKSNIVSGLGEAVSIGTGLGFANNFMHTGVSGYVTKKAFGLLER